MLEGAAHHRHGRSRRADWMRKRLKPRSVGRQMAKEIKKNEAEGLGQSVLGVLGLVDIIIGGLFLYAAFDFQRPTNPVFHTTGFPFVDVALLACAAALLGKVLSLMAFFVMGLMRRILRESSSALR